MTQFSASEPLPENTVGFTEDVEVPVYIGMGQNRRQIGTAKTRLEGDHILMEGVITDETVSKKLFGSVNNYSIEVGPKHDRTIGQSRIGVRSVQAVPPFKFKDKEVTDGLRPEQDQDRR